MLFALPTLRMLMDAPLGSYIDLVCFAWCMVLVALAVVLFFSASYADHEHLAPVGVKYNPPQAVEVVNHHDSSSGMVKMFSRVFSRKVPKILAATSMPLSSAPPMPLAANDDDADDVDDDDQAAVRQVVRSRSALPAASRGKQPV